ncbi:hypothetical protein [Halogeometricum rufum]|uniref:hypothetical protein n=1 Tax=Halogeometricum rufum TaxID=553469 RepID=UPI001160B1B8|nr:hypothetical protein [Halogeometricum rufum]
MRHLVSILSPAGAVTSAVCTVGSALFRGDDVWGLGVGCNGVIDILLEPLDETYRPAVEAFEAGRGVGVLTVVEATDADRVAARAYYDPDADEFSLGESFPADVAERVREATAELTAQGRADTFEHGRGVGVR